MNLLLAKPRSRRAFLQRAGLTAATAPLFFAGKPLFADESTRPKSGIRITDHGARTHRNELNTAAIQAAIDAAHAAGGGLVRVPEGRFRTGALLLKSNL